MEKESENITLAQNIRKIRSIRGFSQDYVAQKLKITQAAYSYMEQGKTAISEDSKEKIAGILGVDKEILEHFNDGIIFNNCTQSGNVGNSGNSTYNHNSVEEIKALYAQLLEEKEARIKMLEKIVGKYEK